MSDQQHSEQSNPDESSPDESSTGQAVGGYGDQGEAEALLGDAGPDGGDAAEPDPKDDPKAAPAEGSDPENPEGL